MTAICSFFNFLLINLLICQHSDGKTILNLKETNLLTTFQSLTLSVDDEGYSRNALCALN
jgi:hypothetical protein